MQRNRQLNIGPLRALQLQSLNWLFGLSIRLDSRFIRKGVIRAQHKAIRVLKIKHIMNLNAHYDDLRWRETNPESWEEVRRKLGDYGKLLGKKADLLS